MAMSLYKKVVLLSGGTGDLSLSLTHLLTQQGAQLVILTRSLQRAQHLLHQNERLSRQVTTGHIHVVEYHQFDTETCQRVVKETKKVCQQDISALIVSHGTTDSDALSHHVTEDMLLQSYRDNTLNSLILAKECFRSLRQAAQSKRVNPAPHNEKQNEKREEKVEPTISAEESEHSYMTSSVLFVGSIVGSMGNIGQLPYATSKAALIGATRTLSKEWAHARVRVNLLLPGLIRSKMTAPFIESHWSKALDRRDWQRRAAEASEIASVAAFLSSPAASYVTGSVINVDGGLSNSLA